MAMQKKYITKASEDGECTHPYMQKKGSFKQWTKGQVPKFENKKKNSGLKEVVCVMHKI